MAAPPSGSVPEIVDDGVTGFLRDDEAGLADAVRRAASLDRRRCVELAKQRFTVERMVADHLRLYQRVLTGRASELLAG